MPIDATWPLTTAVPIALLPVGLETRFNGTELLVRIYPQTLHADAHEPELTEEEAAWGAAFWKRVLTAGDGEMTKRAAWAELAAHFGPQRSAWIVRILSPTNARNPARAARRPESWTRAPRTSVLPRRWIALGYDAKGEQIFAESTQVDTRDPLNVGPSPTKATTSGPATGGLPGDADMQWMLDFQAAVDAGMALRVSLTPPYDQGFETLIVLGVKDVLPGVSTPDELALKSAERLEALLEAQHYSHGVGFVPFGTPTNSAADTPSGYSSHDPGFDVSYNVEIADLSLLPEGPPRPPDGPPLPPGLPPQPPHLPPPPAGSSGATAARALGLASTIFTNVRHGRAEDGDVERREGDALRMNAALWPATWGYYLDQMMAGTLKEADRERVLRRVRCRFIQWVRALGPYPTLRVGNEPYPLLPVTSLDRWTPTSDAWTTSPEDLATDGAIADFIRRLRDNVWRPSVANVPTVDGAADPDATLVKILGMEGMSTSFAARSAVGAQYADYLFGFLNSATAKMDGVWWQQLDDLTQNLRRQVLALPSDPRLTEFSFANFDFRIGKPLVQPDTSAGVLLNPTNYIDSLLTSSWKTVRGQEPGGIASPPDPATLLHLLLRHAALLEYTYAARQLSVTASLQRWLEPELVEFSEGEEPFWDVLSKQPYNGTVIGDYLDSQREALKDLTSATGPIDCGSTAPLGEFGEFWQSLTYLKNRPAAVLESLLVEGLDACSQRLDAWATSFATQRLDALRRTRPRGVYLGGYGWVQGVHPADPQATQSADGFVHAPSLAHAVTAAILRSGYLTHRGEAASGPGSTADAPFAVDLSSDRVRRALHILRGVRQGQPLGALLGYRFERGLHDAALDAYITPLRQLYPLVAGKLTSSGALAESVAANNVVDGLTLQRAWQSGKIPWGQQKLPGSDGSDANYGKLTAQLAVLDDTTDAVADVMLAESVHHAARGNPLRAGGTLDAMARGDAPPDVLEVVQTPRSGVAATHRLVVLFSGDAASPKTWAPSDRSSTVRRKARARQVRASAEQQLNAWAATLLGDPAKVRFQAWYLDPDGQVLSPPGVREVSLSKLGLSPLDVIYMVDSGAGVQRSEIEQRIAYYMSQTRPAGVAPGAEIGIDFGPVKSRTKGLVSVGEFQEAARAARAVLTNARALDARDLAPPDVTAPTAVVDVADIEKRANDAVTAFTVASTALHDALAAPIAESLDALRGTLYDLTFFGIQGAMPLSTAGSADADRGVLARQGESIATELEPRVARLNALQAELTASTAPEARLAIHLQRLSVVLGEAFRVLPRFKPGNAAVLAQALQASDQLQGGDAQQVVTWFQRIARVRDGAARLLDALAYAEALASGDALQFAVAQLPYVPGDRWVALKPDGGSRIPMGRLALEVHAQGTVDAAQWMTGLFVDEFVEVVPNRSETTGVAFHFEQPMARAPQAILLAVAPDAAPQWDLATLEAIVLETLDMAQIRAVDVDALGAIGHFLPALFFGVNVNGDAVSTDFHPLADLGS